MINRHYLDTTLDYILMKTLTCIMNITRALLFSIIALKKAICTDGLVKECSRLYNASNVEAIMSLAAFSMGIENILFCVTFSLHPIRRVAI